MHIYLCLKFNFQPISWLGCPNPTLMKLPLKTPFSQPLRPFPPLLLPMGSLKVMSSEGVNSRRTTTKVFFFARNEMSSEIPKCLARDRDILSGEAQKHFVYSAPYFKSCRQPCRALWYRAHRAKVYIGLPLNVEITWEHHVIVLSSIDLWNESVTSCMAGNEGFPFLQKSLHPAVQYRRNVWIYCVISWSHGIHCYALISHPVLISTSPLPMGFQVWLTPEQTDNLVWWTSS